MVDGLEKPGLSCKTAGVENASTGWDNLTTTAMDGISVKGHIVQIEANVAQVLVTQDTLVVKEYY